MKRIKEPTTVITHTGIKASRKDAAESINLLPVATSQYVGGVKIGTGVTVAADGTISVSGGSSISPGNPTASVGLAEVNGTAATYMRSDAAPKLDQTISPTWTGTHTYSGSIIVPTQTKGDNSTKAASTAFVTSAIAGITPISGANPTAKVGTQAINGTANTYMRSDAAPALDLSISPTWTGAHTYSDSISVPTQKAGDSSTKAASTAFVASTVQTAIAGIPPLSPATATVLGGVKIGSGINVQEDGTISVSSSESVSPGNPTATVGLTAVDGSATTYMRSDAAPALDQTISPTWSGTHTFSGSIYVPTASQSDNSTKAASTAFVASAIASIPQPGPATTQSLGVVQIGDNINVQNGVISVAAPYSLPTASQSVLGGVKIGNNINVTSDGTISVAPSSNTPTIMRTGGTITTPVTHLFVGWGNTVTLQLPPTFANGVPSFDLTIIVFGCDLNSVVGDTVTINLVPSSSESGVTIYPTTQFSFEMNWTGGTPPKEEYGPYIIRAINCSTADDSTYWWWVSGKNEYV